MDMEEKKPKITKKNAQTPQFTEGVDFYIENGLYVFTEKYLRERGKCCQSGCRHCPFGFKKEKTR
jgi:hypothetical protein